MKTSKERWMFNTALSLVPIGKELTKDELRAVIESDELTKEFYPTKKGRKTAFLHVLLALFHKGHMRFVKDGQPLLVRIK